MPPVKPPKEKDIVKTRTMVVNTTLFKNQELKELENKYNVIKVAGDVRTAIKEL